MKIVDWNLASPGERQNALSRPAARADAALRDAVAAIVEDIGRDGWEAVSRHALRIDGSTPERVETAPLAAAARADLAGEALAAIELAAANIAAFHRDSLPAEHEVSPLPGLTVRKVWRAVDRVGLYVPGGATPLFSTLLMLALPARAAGVGEIVAVTPPRPDGGLDPLVALAADLCGIDAIWTVGGAQAIAALALGAGALPRVDKICGPGNVWVAEAKKQVSVLPGGPAIDMPAGPSELLVVADDDADPEMVVADLLSQAEHDSSAQVLLATPSVRLAQLVAALIGERAASLPRADIVAASLREGRIVLTASVDQALDFANLYAPEHLSLAIGGADQAVARVRNAGAVFAGGWAAETFGDYLAGSSHVLPTDGAARAWSGISVHSFLKSMSVQSVSAAAAGRLAAPAALLARMEGLEAHARAADARRAGIGA